VPKMACVVPARLVALALLIAAAAAVVVEKGTYQFPAEWEPHEAVWLGWPPDTYGEQYGRTNKDVSVDIMCALANYSVPVRLAVSDHEQFMEASDMLAGRCPQHSVGHWHRSPASSITVFDIPHTDAWWRDMGPQFLARSGGGGDGAAPLRVLDVGFNYWGWRTWTKEDYSRDILVDENVDRLTAMQLGLQTATHTDWSHEGGNIDVFRPAGNHPAAHEYRLMAVRAVAMQRNPHLTLEQVEARMLASYGYSASAVLWLDEGSVEDGLLGTGPFDFGLGYPVYTMGTGGHVDGVARWTPDGSVMLTMPSAEDAAKGPAQRESRRRMLRNAELLRRANISVLELPAMPTTLTVTLEPDTDFYDILASAANACDPEKPYTLCQPFPDGEPVQYEAGAGYANFLVTNGVVLMQKYCVPGLCESHPELAETDARAEAVLRRVYGKDREVVAIDAFAVNLGGGGIHCYTQQQPRVAGGSLQQTPSLRGQALLV